MKKKLLVLLLIAPLLIGAFFAFNSKKEVKNWPPHQFSETDIEFQKNHVLDRYFSGVDATKNYYSAFINPNGQIPNPLIIVTGLEDITESWWETVQKAQKMGFQRIYIHELRGQGRSEKVHGNSINANHVERFSHYTKDFLSFLKDIQQIDGPPLAPAFYIAHSTGSLVLAASLSEIKKKQSQWDPAKLVFWTPLVSPKISPMINNPIVVPILSLVERIARFFGLLILGKKFEDPIFEGNHLTYDKKKFDRLESIRLGEKLKSSGVSLKWALETYPLADKIRKNHYSMIQVPCLIFRAEDDLVVQNQWEVRNSHFKILDIPKSRHALHTETPEVFNSVFSQSMKFLLAP